MFDIFLTNSWHDIEAHHNEDFIKYVAAPFPSHKETKFLRIIEIDKWVKENNIEAHIILRKYLSERNKQSHRPDQFMYFYRFEYESDAVECALRFGDGNIHRWPNETFIGFID